MKIYRDDGEPLHEIMKAASSEQGATLLVPDLQRPYVWTPSQVILLIDTLLRGWRQRGSIRRAGWRPGVSAKLTGTIGAAPAAGASLKSRPVRKLCGAPLGPHARTG